MSGKRKIETIGPQPGPQTKFLESEADVVIYGGAAGGGKSFGLLLEPLRHIHIPNFGAVIFRRTTENILKPGGLWEESEGLYPLLGAHGSGSGLIWRFPSGATIRFAHMQHEKTRFEWHGSQIPLIEFDELTEFPEKVFWYMMSRNRSATGIPGYIRASCNADADSFVAKLIHWWIDHATGYPVEARSGVIRWFVRVGDALVWADTRKELEAKHPSIKPKSLTFIRSLVTDNKILLRNDPSYLSNLQMQPTVDRERLLCGNWKIKATAGSYFKRTDFKPVTAVPVGCRVVRSWDRAGTEPRVDNPDPDWTRGIKLARHETGMYYVMDMKSCRARPSDVIKLMRQTAAHDGNRVEILIQQDPGSAGISEKDDAIRQLAGFAITANVVTKDKVTKCKPASTQAGAGNMCIVVSDLEQGIVPGSWQDEFLTELENFPTKGIHDDVPDALSEAVNYMGCGSFQVQKVENGQPMPRLKLRKGTNLP